MAALIRWQTFGELRHGGIADVIAAEPKTILQSERVAPSDSLSFACQPVKHRRHGLIFAVGDELEALHQEGLHHLADGLDRDGGCGFRDDIEAIFRHPFGGLHDPAIIHIVPKTDEAAQGAENLDPPVL